MVLAWLYKLDFKQHLTEEETVEACKVSAEKIVHELKQFRAKIEMAALVGIGKQPSSGMLEDLTILIEDGEMLDGEISEVNYWLSKVYDWGDDYRVLIGGERIKAN